MAYTYDLTTEIGQVRLLIGDNDIVPVTDAHFTDEEIQAMLTMAGSVYKACVLLLKSWAATLSGQMDSEHIGDYSYTRKEVANKLALAANFEALDISTPAMGWADMDLLTVPGMSEEE